MKTVKLFLKSFFISALLMAAFSSCKKDSGETTSTPAPVNKPPVKPSWQDTILRKWRVTDATHNGAPDGSSKGLELELKKGGVYDLISEGYTGTWKFTDSTCTQVLLDEKEPAFKTTWTIVTLTSKKLVVDFKSPFTGGKAHWVMSAF